MAKSLKTYSSVLWVFKILKVKSRYLQELIKSFPVEFFLSFSSYIDEILFDFSQKLFDKERIVIAYFTNNLIYFLYDGHVKVALHFLL